MHNWEKWYFMKAVSVLVPSACFLFVSLPSQLLTCALLADQPQSPSCPHLLLICLLHPSVPRLFPGLFVSSLCEVCLKQHYVVFLPSSYSLKIIFTIHWIVTRRIAPLPLIQAVWLAWYKTVWQWLCAQHPLTRTRLSTSYIVFYKASQAHCVLGCHSPHDKSR